MADAALMNNVVYDIERCPHCGVATPLLTLRAKPTLHYKDSFEDMWWHFTASCSRCHRHVLFYGWTNYAESPSNGQDPSIVRVKVAYPPLEKVAEALPVRAQRFLQQAIESKHAPDGALMLSASAIDAMMKEKGYKIGSLFSRIEQAHADGVLTKEMREWAHEIRLSANEPRHADDEFEGASEQDVSQHIQFAQALGEYLFVLPAKVKKWKEAAKPAS